MAEAQQTELQRQLAVLSQQLLHEDPGTLETSPVHLAAHQLVRAAARGLEEDEDDGAPFGGVG
eukprot:5872930-Prymnesium_polylepis.1